MERVTYVDFDETILITSTVTNIGYWLAKATGDNKTNIFNAGGETFKPINPPVDIHVVAESLPSFFIPSAISTGEAKDIRDVGEEDLPEEVDLEEIPPGSPEMHPDPYIDSTQISLPKRIPKDSQKVLDNKKWDDLVMWAQRAIAHIKSTKSLEAERLYCRQATLSYNDPHHYDFEPEYDLTTTIQQIAEIRY